MHKVEHNVCKEQWCLWGALSSLLDLYRIMKCNHEPIIAFREAAHSSISGCTIMGRAYSQKRIENYALFVLRAPRSETPTQLKFASCLQFGFETVEGEREEKRKFSAFCRIRSALKYRDNLDCEEEKYRKIFFFSSMRWYACSSECRRWRFDGSEWNAK